MDEIFVMDECCNDAHYREPEPLDSIDITETDNESESSDDMVIDDILYDDSDSDDSDDSDYIQSDGEDEIDQIIEVIRENKKRILKSVSVTLSKRHK